MKSPISIKRRAPALGDNPDYSCALYPDPPSHDFCVWLIIAELMRRYHNAAGALQVQFGFIRGQLGVVDFGPHGLRSGESYQCGVSKAYHDTMIENVLRPAIEMIGAVERPTIDLEKASLEEVQHLVEYDYHIGHLVDAGREGYDIPKWSVPEWAKQESKAFLDGKKPIIITLRETDVQPPRNSRVPEWLRFAQSVERDYPVLFVRDTLHAGEGLGPFQTCERASRNAYVRAALYQEALVNMMVCNGPNTWCIFSDAPYLIFKELVPELPGWAHGHPFGWKDQDHMDVGDQYPWAHQEQRLTWTSDTFRELSDAFDQFVELRKAA